MSSAAAPVTFARDWLGSLHGWHDSTLILAWRSGMTAIKGKPSLAICAD